jgi:aldehyde dehydrogenase (NAD+)
MQDISSAIQCLRKGFAFKKHDYAWREKQLKALLRLFEENSNSFEEALFKDLKQNAMMRMVEPMMCITEIKHALKNLKQWMQAESVPNNMIFNLPGTASLKPEPYGIVLIIAPWNYPVQLLGRPLVGALAAGNSVLVKPSEVSANVSAVFGKLIPKYFSEEDVVCIEGGADVTTEILKHKFDYIFYTGSTAVGRIIMKAAAEHLTPVTLELGGKSPTIVDRDAESYLEVAAKRIVWGKLLNAGQTCIAPDYVLVHKDIEQKFVAAVKKVIKSFYGENPKKSDDYSRIISQKHTQRLGNLLEGNRDKIELGGEIDEVEKYVSPTLLRNPDPNTALMQEEIFGPILPILSMDSIEKACDFINNRPKPLALYIFSNNQKTIDYVIDNTSSGGVSINETIAHVSISTLPFGGVGESGMGAYNGKSSFDTFSHKKPIFRRPTWFDLNAKYPPYASNNLSILKYATIELPSMKNLLLVPTLVVLAAIAFALFK